MGISIGFSRSSYDSTPIKQIIYETRYSPNPNLERFKIQRYQEIKNYLVVEINYYDATNYEGNKILVFQDYSIEKLKRRKSIDPHFSENKKFKSPIARFEPTKKGWSKAISFCTYC
jgi:hypothetical protein